MEKKAEELAKVAEEIAKCAKCPLQKTRHNVVPGYGSSHAEILFVGEAPGANEDEQGVPFCGAAGKFLDEMLASIGMDRNQVFIANTLKCRPPQNRDPEESEKQACRPYLDRQIDIIKPKLIVCLGRHSVATLMPGAGGISKLHGRVIKRPNGQVYLALYHPAAALHNGGLRAVLLKDFGKIPAIIEKIKSATNDKVKKDKSDTGDAEKNIKQIKLL